MANENSPLVNREKGCEYLRLAGSLYVLERSKKPFTVVESVPGGCFHFRSKFMAHIISA